MYYWAYFRNTDTSKDKRGQLYKVVIITNFQNNGYTKEGGELKLTSSPFTVNYSGEDDNLFKPYKCSTATVSFYQDRINKDFYSVRGNDILVTLFKLKDGVTPKEVNFGGGNVIDVNYPSHYDYRDYTVEWIGFATPNAFNVSYNSDYDVFEMQAQDALSTLQYYDYSPCYDKIENTTLYKVLLNTISCIGIYKNIYISDNISLPSSDYDNRDITQQLYISEQNFFNEDGEAKKMIEVLSDIMLYLNMTAVGYGDSLYILDYTAISNNFSNYHWIKSKVTSNNGSIIITLDDNLPWVNMNGRTCNDFNYQGIININHKKEIEANDIADYNTNFSLGSTYNKVKVIDDNYYKDSIELLSNLTPANVYSTLKTYNIVQLDKSETKVNQYSITVEKSDKDYTQIRDKNNKVFLNKYYGISSNNDVDIKTYWYQDNYSCEWIYGDEEEGGGIIGETFEWVSSTPVNIDNDKITYDVISKYTGVAVVDEAIVSDLEVPSFKRVYYFTAALQNSKHGGCSHYQLPTRQFIESSTAKSEKVIEFTLLNQSVTNKDYIIINGDFNFYAISAPLSDYGVQNRISNAKYNFIWAKLECDGKYWNGSEWVNSNTMFRLPVTNSSVSSSSIVKNIGFKENLTSTGYGMKIPVSDKGVTNTDIKLTLYRIFGLDYYSETELTVLKNFEFNIISPVTDVFSSNKSNTEYSNIINNSAIEEYNDISLNITTYNNKDSDYSTVYCCESYYTESITPIYRLARFVNTSTGNICSAEEHIINNITTQYQLPNTILDISVKANEGYKPYSLVTYKHFDNSLFVVDGMSIDYASNINTLHLVEKLTSNKSNSLQKRSKKRDYQRNGDIINNAQGVKKDDKIISYPYVTGGGDLYRNGNTVELKGVGNTLIDWENPLILDSDDIVRQAYMRFIINDKGELVYYYPSLLSPTASINSNGELLVNS